MRKPDTGGVIKSSPNRERERISLSPLLGEVYISACLTNSVKDWSPNMSHDQM